MKDIVIKAKTIKRELKWLGAMFVIAYALNIYSIVAYDGKWSELFLSIGFVCTTAVLLYLVTAVLRITIYAITKLITKK